MTGLLPHFAQEPPPAYVEFVERHLEPLRRDTAQMLGAGHDTDDVYSSVLTDVAIRWEWFELLRRRLGRPDPAAAYLPRALARRSAHWRELNETDDTPIEVWSGDDPARAWRRLPSPVRVSAAERLARVRPMPLATASAVAEASIAWWHAYEAHVRHKRIAAAAVGVIVMILLFRVQRDVAV